MWRHGTAPARPRYMLRSDPTSPVVELWSNARLAPARTGWRRDMQQDLHQALSTLPPGGPAILRGCYAESHVQLPDIDLPSILFSVINTTLPARPASAGLCFERALRLPPHPPEPLYGNEVCYLRWELQVPGAPFQHWQEDAPFAIYTDVDLEPLRTLHSFLPAWLAFRSAPCTLSGDRGLLTPFGIRAELTVPETAGCDTPRIAGTLLTAITSSLQVFTGDIAQAAPAIGASLRQDPARIADLLASDERGVLRWPLRLNPHTYLAPALRTRVHPWAAEVLVRRARVAGWSCSARVFALRPAHM